MFGNFKLIPIFVFLSGCHIHPLPDDVTRQSTVDIVERIRCEAAAAVDKLVTTGRLDRTALPATYIGYEFQFLMTENNNASGSGMFRYPFSSGTLNVGISGGADRARASDRNFRIVESFEKLRDSLRVCTKERFEKNAVYPIAGSIGLSEVIATYVGLEKLTDLQPQRRQGQGQDQGDNRQDGNRQDGNRPDGNRPGGNRRDRLAEENPNNGRNGNTRRAEDDEPVPTFSDKLTFTTKFSAGVNPSLSLKAVPRSFRLVEAEIDLTAARTDVHKVTVAIAVDKKRRGQQSLRTFYSMSRPGFTYYNAVAPTPLQQTTPARDRVLLELDRQRLLDLGVLGFPF
jgi:hypothetical protein